MAWLGTSEYGLSSPITVKPGEMLSHENYIEAIRPHAQAKDQYLLSDDFIDQRDNATS
ncbi:unnamed protein product, partial [Rotaria sp. Silwood2]